MIEASEDRYPFVRANKQKLAILTKSEPNMTVGFTSKAVLTKIASYNVRKYVRVISYTRESLNHFTPAQIFPSVSITLKAVRKIRLSQASASGLPSRNFNVEAEVKPGKMKKVRRKT